MAGSLLIKAAMQLQSLDATYVTSAEFLLSMMEDEIKRGSESFEQVEIETLFDETWNELPDHG